MTARKRVRCKKGATVEQRLRLHMTVAPSGCWMWLGALSQRRPGCGRYGRMTVDKKVLYAHRVSYETFVGPIPEGLQLDHLCRRPNCINPRHLQPVTAQTNMRRGTSPGARAVRRDRCLKGHSYAEHAVIYDGRRYCRACHRATSRRHARDARVAELAARQKVMADLIAHRDRDLKVSA